MSKMKSRHDDLLRYYQTWLIDFTKLLVRQGMCDPQIYTYHRLVVSSLRFPDRAEVAIVPEFIYRLVKPSELLVDDRGCSLEMDRYSLLHHPMLEGVLLSECLRLKQPSLANWLGSLLRHFGSSEIKHKLVMLSWYDLLVGYPALDGVETLKFKASPDLNDWINQRQAENTALTFMMDEYVLSNSPSCQRSPNSVVSTPHGSRLNEPPPV
ncbi:hypothetical protein A9Q62_14475 [Yersinia ruckeri]|uniref:hypothetical protein n=1 Tax=Yersinia ruckeri TaxID=29486 RepID=UPI0008FDCC4A|nr:hypothetical protein [Yersinia ruckeri]OJB84720.1 hypothetical protein A9Q62_14475 [Yersinia ruckeri]OJB91143.1 hypothetical protein A9Q60_14105 [Yersinia ruckeri]WMS05872.1 hypothetical protein RDY86_01480 [Yersinia ruckeri]